jgi:hypothetical protein
MFNDAASAKAGRLITVNPFADLGIAKGPGNRHRQPPTERQMWTLVRHARDLTPPSFAAWLEVACFTAIRPGELDALRWEEIRFDDGEIDVVQQYSAKTREFTAPKYGPYTVALVEHARDTLLAMPRATATRPGSSPPCAARTTRRPAAPTTGTASAPPPASAPPASTSPPATTSAGTRSTSSSSTPRSSPSSSATATAASSSSSSTATPIASAAGPRSATPSPPPPRSSRCAPRHRAQSTPTDRVTQPKSSIATGKTTRWSQESQKNTSTRNEMFRVR